MADVFVQLVDEPRTQHQPTTETLRYPQWPVLCGKTSVLCSGAPGAVSPGGSALPICTNVKRSCPSSTAYSHT